MHAEIGALTEPVPVEDELCSGVAMIENLGFAARVVFYARQTIYETGEEVLVVKRKIVLPIEGVRESAEAVLSFLAHVAVGRFGSARPIAD